MFRSITFAAALSLVASGAHAQALAVVPDTAPAIHANALLRSTQDITGEPLSYPEGTAEFTVESIVIDPGAETGWHMHTVPLFARIESGTLTVDYGSRGLRTYNAGDVMLEAVNWPHNGHNAGTEPVVLLAIFIGAVGATLTEPATQQ